MLDSNKIDHPSNNNNINNPALIDHQGNIIVGVNDLNQKNYEQRNNVEDDRIIHIKQSSSSSNNNTSITSNNNNNRSINNDNLDFHLHRNEKNKSKSSSLENIKSYLNSNNNNYIYNDNINPIPPIHNNDLNLGIPSHTSFLNPNNNDYYFLSSQSNHLPNNNNPYPINPGLIDMSPQIQSMVNQPFLYGMYNQQPFPNNHNNTQPIYNPCNLPNAFMINNTNPLPPAASFYAGIPQFPAPSYYDPYGMLNPSACVVPVVPPNLTNNLSQPKTCKRKKDKSWWCC